MRLRLVLSALATNLMLGLFHNAAACSLSNRQLAVQLEEGSASLGAKNAHTLAEWFLQWRDGLGIESLIVVAPAVKSSRKLADKRLQNVSQIFEGLNTGNAPITYEIEERDAGFPDAKYLNSLDVNVQPACIKAGTCCVTDKSR